MIAEGGHADVHDQGGNTHDKGEAKSPEHRRDFAVKGGRTGPQPSPKGPQRDEVIGKINEEAEQADFLEDVEILGIGKDLRKDGFGGSVAE